MNHLLHLYLVGSRPEARLGALFGDYIKGPLDRRLPAGVRYGIRHHRQLDCFAASAAPFRRSKQRLNPALRHCRGILVDVAYDHILATHWERYHPQPLEEYAASIYALLQANRARLPQPLLASLPRMLAADWLVALRELDHIDIILQRLASRLSRPNLLGDGLQEIVYNLKGLQADFTTFMIDARLFFRTSYR